MKIHDNEIAGLTLRTEYETNTSFIEDSVEKIGVTKKYDYDELKNMDASAWITLIQVRVIQPKKVMPLTLSPNILSIIDEELLDEIRDEIKQVELQKL